MTAGYPIGAGATLAELEEDPHPLLARLRAAEPVSWLPVLDGWLVTRYDLAVRVMRDPRTFTVDDPRFSTARVVGPSMLSLDGEEHARHREPFAHPFKPAQVRGRFTEFVEAEAERLISAMEPLGAAELRASFAGPLAVAVVAEALGLEDADAATVLGWYASIVDSVSEVTAGRPVTTAGQEAFEQLSSSVRRSIAGRRESVLLAAADRLSSRALVSNAAVLMFGGIDTTEGMITNAVLHLLSHNEKPSENAVEESVRLEPAAAVVDRYATQGVELGGASIGRGELVVVSIAGANRDPAVFAEPDRFDARRPNARISLAFAQGTHFCLGAQLARMETLIGVRQLFERLPGLRLARPSAPHGLVFRKPPELHLAWVT